MRGKIQKWGNSLAMRIPRSFAQGANIEDGSNVDLQLRGRRLIVVPIEPQPTLKSLLAGVTADNLHGETDTGERVGGEVW